MADGLFLLVNNVVEALSTEERRTLLYLCSDLLSADCVEDCRGALITLTVQTPANDAFLKEILFRLNRFDLLKRHLRTSRKEVEEILKTRGRVVSEYRVLMMELCESLAADEFKSLTFLLSRTMPKGPLERATNFLDLVMELEKMDMVSCEKLEVVEQCLRDIRRMDLAKRIQLYQRGQHGAQREKFLSPTATRNGTQFGLNHNRQAPVRIQQQPIEGFEALKLSVAESGVQHSQVPVNQHFMNNEGRGVCVIIDCIGYDGDLLKETFGRLGFRVDLHTMLSGRQVFSLLRSVSQQAELKQASNFSCCLLSRGSDTHLLATDAEGQGLALADLRQMFSPVRCPLLLGKPKLFFTQNYVEDPPILGLDDLCLETDGVPSGAVSAHILSREALPAAADVLWSECRTPAWQLERRGHRSVYLQALSAALLRARERKLNVLDALTEVNREIYEHNQRNPDAAYHITLSHTLRKSLCL